MYSKRPRIDARPSIGITNARSTMAKSEHTAADIVRRLDILISVTLDGSPATGLAKTASKIYRLADLGLSQPEIAGIVGKGVNYVSATLHQRRPPKKGKATKP